MLNLDFKEKWIEALESDKYTQTTSRLRDENRFCCLGVACDLLKPEDWIKYDNWVFQNSEKRNTYLIPDDLADSIGLTNKDQEWLAHMNDDGNSFKEIAQEIREKL